MLMSQKGPLFEKWPEWEMNESKREAAGLRLSLYHGKYADLVKKMISSRIVDTAAANVIVKCVNTAHGLAGTVTDALSVTYQRGARRELRGVDKAAAKAFSDLVSESGMVERAVSLNALSWISGPIVLVPYVAESRGTPRLCLATMTADRTEVRRNTDRPDDLTAVLWQRDDGTFVEVDHEGWRYWSAKGEPLNVFIPHGLDWCPAVVFRSRAFQPYDWWNTVDHAGLCEATLEVAFRLALALYMRQNSLLPVVEIVGPNENIPKGQAIHPIRPLYFDANPQQVRVAVHERKVDVAGVWAEIDAIVKAAVSRYGIPATEAQGFSASTAEYGTVALKLRGGLLGRLRDAQAPLIRASERALWAAAAAVVRASAHRHASTLPDAEAFELALRVMLPDLQDPEEQIKWIQALKEGLPLGLSSPVDWLMALRPELTREEAEEELQANLQNYIDVIRPLVERNTPADPGAAVSANPATGEVESIAQVQGREGGIASGESRRQENDS